MKGRIELARLYEDYTWDTFELHFDHDENPWKDLGEDNGDDYEAMAWEIARRYMAFMPHDKVVLAAPHHFDYSDLVMEDEDEEEYEDWLDEDDYTRYGDGGDDI